jgi:excisionase family DNA binding protein
MATDVQARPLLSVSATAERLGVSEKTVRRLISSGVLPALRIGAQLRIDPDELDQYVYGDAA